MNYEDDGTLITAYYTNSYITAKIMDTAKDNFYTISHLPDKKSQNYEPNFLKIITSCETSLNLIIHIIKQSNGIILEITGLEIIAYFKEFLNSSKTLISLKKLNIRVKFAKINKIQHLKDMFDLE